MLDYLVPYIPVVVSIIALLGYWITTTWRPNGTRELALLQELQEEVGNERKKREALELKVDNVTSQVHGFQIRDVLWEIHSTRLEAQVIDLGADPHDRPPELSPFRRFVSPVKEVVTNDNKTDG